MSDCPHPTWRQVSDGHTSTGWECTKCEEYSWIAPWIINGYSEID